MQWTIVLTVFAQQNAYEATVLQTAETFSGTHKAMQLRTLTSYKYVFGCACVWENGGWGIQRNRENKRRWHIAFRKGNWVSPASRKMLDCLKGDKWLKSRVSLRNFRVSNDLGESSLLGLTGCNDLNYSGNGWTVGRPEGSWYGQFILEKIDLCGH